MKWIWFLIVILTSTNEVNSQVWDSLGIYTYGDSKHNQIHNNKLLVGGIDTSQGVSTFNLSTWDGSLWESIGGGIDGQVYSTSIFNGKLFIGGIFDYAGGPYPWPAPHIYQLTAWDGIQYYNFNYPNGNKINELRTFNNELYIGTNTVTINNQIYNGILKYNDSTWSDVGGGLNGFPRDVHTMEEFNGNLIAGGEFSIAGSSLSVSNIASWDGTNWSPLGNGLNAAVRTLVVDSINNILYAGGSFDFADTVQVNHIAKWDGISWQNIGAGVPIIVVSMCIYKNELYAGGGNAWGLHPSSLYKWNGSGWIPIIPAPLGNINSLTVFQGSLYVSGGFGEIGGIRYSGIAKYTDTTLTTFNDQYTDLKLNVYPNPSNGHINISISNITNEKINVSIFDSKGELVYKKNYSNINKDSIVVLDNNFISGTYICVVNLNNKRYFKKFNIGK